MQSTIYKDVDKAVSNDSTPHIHPEDDSRLGWGEEASRVYESTKER